MTEREIQTAKAFNILENVTKLEDELLAIKGVNSVQYDLDGFYDHMDQVIFLTEHDIPYENRKQFIKEIITVANRNGLTKTQDSIEDYGAHYYFVFQCDSSWNKCQV